jgi:hypothetical protein
MGRLLAQVGPAALLALSLLTAGCGSGAGTTAPGPSTPPPRPPPTGSPGPIGTDPMPTIDQVDVAIQAWLRDPQAVTERERCPNIVPGTNSTGAPGYRVTAFRQFDCYVDPNGMPTLIQIALWIQFEDEAELERYAREKLPGDRYFQNGTVYIGAGGTNPKFDVGKLLEQVEDACSCGEVKQKPAG